jgi:DNA-directed RNA polymerase beta subunit
MRSFLKRADDIGVITHSPKPPNTATWLPTANDVRQRIETLAQAGSSQNSSPNVVQVQAPSMRDFGDAEATRQLIYDNSLKAALNIQPVQNARYRLSLTNLHYADPDKLPLAADKKAILAGQSLTRRLRGTWQLHDTQGNLIDQKTSTIASIPYMTNRGTFILGGSEYTLGHQMRLRPGIFTRIKENGEIESHINIMPGKGLSHRYFLEPSTGIFSINIGQANLPLISIMRAMGVTDEELRNAWGPELYAANQQKDDSHAIDKLYAKLIGRRSDPKADYETKRQAVVKAITSMELDPEVTKRTLGHPYSQLTKEASLATTRKLLAVSRGEAETDDRDHLAFQHFLGPEDLLAERIGRDKRVMNELLWKTTTKGTLDAIPTGVFTKHVHDAIMESGLGQSLEEINPADVFDQQTRVSRLGYGGIPSIDAVPDEARNVQPSHLGFIDLLRTPESFKVGVDSRMSYAARKGNDNRIYSPFYDPKTGRVVYKSPQDIADLTIAFPNEWNKDKSLVAAMVSGKARYVPRDKVDLIMPHMEQAFSPINNMVPLKSTVKGQRAAMASRFITQALPLNEAEAPYVRGQVPGQVGKSFEEHYGRFMGAVRAKEQAGRVQKVDENGITVRYADGTEETHEIYNHFPYNRKSVVGSTSIVIRRATGDVWEGPIADYEFQSGDLVSSVSPITCDSQWLPVTGYLKHKNDKRLFCVRTVSGRSVTVTEDHSLVEMGDEGSLVAVYPRDCVVGRTRLPVAHVPSSCVADIPGVPNNRHEQMGCLAGLYLSEGHCPSTQPGLVCIAVQSTNRAEEVLKLLRSMDLNPCRNGGNVQFTDHTVCEWLLHHFGAYSHSKFVPGYVLGWSQRFREGLISGYMAGDGYLWSDNNNTVQVAAVSVSARLRDSVLYVLSSLGIFATKFDVPRAHLNPNWKDGYGFRVLNSHLSKLKHEWFFYRDRECKLRKLLKANYRASSFELIPVPRKARKILYDGFSDKPVSHYVHKAVQQGAVAKHRLLGLDGPYGRWAASDILWDTVEDIFEVDHEEWVYDLEVAGSEMFAVNHGLVVHNTYIHNTPVVQAGDPVRPGQLLAKSNYTDQTGTVALGKNLRVAYIPFRGANYEDAYVISESAAKKLASEHMYQHRFEWDDRHRRGKKNYVAIFPGTFDRKVLQNVDNDGIIIPGTMVRPGDPLVLVAQERELSRKQVHAAHKGSFIDSSITWDHHNPGMVTDVEKTDKGVTVTVKSLNEAQVGDKISGRYGDKGVIGQIIPDDQMPRDLEGKPYEVLANPLGIISRTNVGQVIEAVLGKIAAKHGKPYIINDFSEIDDMTEYAQRELEKHNMKGAETIVDPTSGRHIHNVLTGNRFFMKLHHTSESKGQGRGLGSYTAEGMPAKGGTEGSKRLALMDVNALLSHGAIETLRDAKLIRGQKNQEYWSAFMSGFRPPTPKVPMVYEKFINMLKAGGVNVERHGNQLHIMSLTDKDIDALAGDRELQNAETVDWRAGMAPIKGGLFDERLTGGHGGNRWAYIKLHEPLPNPVFEEPIRRLLGLTQKRYEEILAGKEKLGELSGPKAIQAALSSINLDNALIKAREDIKSGRRTIRDDAIRRLGYLKSAQKLGIHPKDWMLEKVPVLPPIFRPISIMQSTGGRLISDANYLYKELFDANNNLKALHDKVDDVSNERLNLYKAFKAVTGLGDPVQPKNQERQVKGMLAQIFGHRPKYSMVQQKLIGTTVDLVGRAVVVPNPDLHMDQIGLPEARAWEVYTPFIVRRLVKRGVGRLQALEYVKDRHDLARRALLEEVNERPVIVTRAPVLHRYGLMAFYPRITKGDTLQVSPIVVGGFNMDFDGDASNYHVPASDEAKEEAVQKLLPSRNLLSTSKFAVHYLPRQEYVGGLFSATNRVDSNKRPRIFANRQAALQAYQRGELDPDQPIQIIN